MARNRDQPETIGKARYRIDPLAFAGALVLAPLLIAVLGFWIMWIPVFALLFGGPFYLLFGGPLFWVFIRRNGVTIWKVALLAVGLCLALLIISFAVGAVTQNSSLLGFLSIYAVFGWLFAFLWGLVFAWFYRMFERAAWREQNLGFPHSILRPEVFD